MTIDERLEFLTQSTESLHASCQELHAASARQAEASTQQAEAIKEQGEQFKRMDARERQVRSAMLDGIAAYLRGLNEEGTNGGPNDATT